MSVTRRRAIGMGAALVAGLPISAEACTIVPFTKKDRRKQKSSHIATIRKFFSSMAKGDRAGVVEAMGVGPWKFHGKRFEQESDPDAVFQIAKNVFPDANVIELSDLADIDGLTFASAWVLPPDYLELMEELCNGDGSKLIHLVFGFSHFPTTIYSAELANG